MELDRITLERIKDYHHALEKMSNLTEDDIIEIFKKPNDKKVTMEYLEEIYNKQYVPMLPLWCTMIFRFRNYDQSPSRLYYGGCDPWNKVRFRGYFCPYEGYMVFGAKNYFGQIIEFLAWIKNMWTPYLLAHLFKLEESDEVIQTWNDNEIKFFFQFNFNFLSF